MVIHNLCMFEIISCYLTYVRILYCFVITVVDLNLKTYVSNIHTKLYLKTSVVNE